MAQPARAVLPHIGDRARIHVGLAQFGQGELGLTVVMHAGDDIGFPDAVRCTPRMTQRALQQVGPVTLVMAHMGGWRHWDEVAALAEHANAYLDTAFSLGSFTPLAEGDYAPGETRLLSAEAFCRLVRTFGAQRVLFATDSPWADQAQALRQFEQLPLFREEKQQICAPGCSRIPAKDHGEPEHQQAPAADTQSAQKAQSGAHRQRGGKGVQHRPRMPPHRIKSPRTR